MATSKKAPLWKRRWVRYTFLTLMMTTAAGLIAAFIALRPYIEYADRYNLSAPKEMERATTIYDRNGIEIARIFVKNRHPVSIEQIPQSFQDALIATEDTRFETHNGVDFWGIARAAFFNFWQGEVNQGASTITQQLARNAYDLKVEFQDAKGRERGIDRKFVEMFLAQRLDNEYSKPEIMEFYLNHIYFGSGYWGVQSAAQGYFGKDIHQLNIEECATIVGLIKSPERLSPFANEEASKESRNSVFLRMRDTGKIPPEEWARLRLRPLVVAPRTAATRAGYVYEEIRQQASELIGEGAAIGGYHIHTTIDHEMQAAAEASVQKTLTTVESRPDYPHQTFDQFRQLSKEFQEEFDRQTKKTSTADTPPKLPAPKVAYLQGAALSIENDTGAVLAMVGGRHFNDSAFNRALQMRRPLGTAFTPVNYAALFSDTENKYWPGSMLEDTPLDNRRIMIGSTEGILGEWGVERTDVVWQGEITMRRALSLSKNGATVRAAELAGLEKIQATAQNLGLRSEIKKLPSSMLGASEYSLDEVCIAYSNFPNGGTHPKNLHFITKITDFEQNQVYRWEKSPDDTIRGLDPVAAFQVHSCLNEALRTGSAAKSASELGMTGFMGGGKTGTYHGQKDLYFVGYDKSVTTAVWVGFDNQKNIYPNAYSHEIAMPIWADITKSSVPSFPPKPIQPPPNSLKVEICEKSGKIATDRCYEVIPSANPSGRSRYIRSTTVEVVRPGTINNDFCTLHAGQSAHPEFEIEQPVPFTPSTPLTAIGGDMSAFVNRPVNLKQPTVIGEDPYHSKKILPRPETDIPKAELADAPPAAIAVDANGTPIAQQPGEITARKAVILELGNQKYRVPLPNPGPIPLQ